MICVIGATGTTGRHVVAGLVGRGFAVRALVRDAHKAKALLSPSVELVVGDLTDRDAVRRALAGTDKVYLAVGQRQDQQQLEEAVVDEAAAIGAAHIVKISVAGVSPGSPSILARWHAAVEQRITDAGLPATFLRANWFSQNFLGSAATVAAEGAIYASAGAGHIAPIDARDIAAVAIAVLTEEGHEGAAYYLTGPESLTFEQVAMRLGAGIGKTISYVDLSDDEFRAKLVGAGILTWNADAYMELMHGIRSEWFVEVSPVVEEVLGRPARSFEEFARDNAAAFAG